MFDDGGSIKNTTECANDGCITTTAVMVAIEICENDLTPLLL